MKKIIFLILGGLLFFVVLVGLVFGILILMDNSEKQVEVIDTDKAINEENNSILGLLLSEKQTIIDSLTTILQNTNDSLATTTIYKDSLAILTIDQSKTLKADSLKIARLEKTIAAEIAKQKAQPVKQDDGSENFKELAKTYEQMKISEMKPIFAQLDDKTIIGLYNAMSARKRPLILKALNTKRAADITKKLAK